MIPKNKPYMFVINVEIEMKINLNVKIPGDKSAMHKRVLVMLVQ